MNYQENLVQFLIGCCGAATAEVLHWHRIARRKRLPKYAKSAFYWLVTLLLVLCGGTIAAAVSPAGSSPLQLLIIGVAGPQLLQMAAQSRLDSQKNEVFLGTEKPNLFEFLRS